MTISAVALLLLTRWNTIVVMRGLTELSWRRQPRSVNVTVIRCIAADLAEAAAVRTADMTAIPTAAVMRECISPPGSFGAGCTRSERHAGRLPDSGGLAGAALVPRLDAGELLGAALRDRTHEPVPRREQPPAAHEEQRADDRDRRVVHRHPGEPVLEGDSRGRDREDEEDRDERHPDAGDRSDRLVPAPERPLAGLPRVALA